MSLHPPIRAARPQRVEDDVRLAYLLGEGVLVFDYTGVFARWFKPVGAGYLYYPKAGAGGKFVTAEEYERLLAGWGRAAGRRGTWMSVGVVSAVIFLWILAAGALGLPEWTNWIIAIASFAGALARIWWAASAPVRLVKNRPDYAPALPASEMRREARATVKWPFVLCVLALSATGFIGHIINGDRSPNDWAWLLGSGLFLAAYLRIAILKLRDRWS